MKDEREAKSIANKREQLQREQGLRTQKHITLDEIGRRIAIGDFQGDKALPGPVTIAFGHGCHAAWPRMAAAGSGQVVNTASAFGLLPGPLYAAYTATKHGVVGLSRALRAEGRELGIGVTAVCPGFVRTRILDNAVMSGVDRARAEAAVPFRFLEQTDEDWRKVLDINIMPSVWTARAVIPGMRKAGCLERSCCTSW